VGCAGGYQPVVSLLDMFEDMAAEPAGATSVFGDKTSADKTMCGDEVLAAATRRRMIRMKGLALFVWRNLRHAGSRRAGL